MRRATAILALALALALGGCGAADEPERAAAPAVPKGDWGPEQPGSGVRARRATYFDRARVVLDDGPKPTTYVRAPC